MYFLRQNSRPTNARATGMILVKSGEESMQAVTWERNQHSQHPHSVRILDLHFTFVDLCNPQRQFYGVGIIFTL